MQRRAWTKLLVNSSPDGNVQQKLMRMTSINIFKCHWHKSLYANARNEFRYNMYRGEWSSIRRIDEWSQHITLWSAIFGILWSVILKAAERIRRRRAVEWTVLAKSNKDIISVLAKSNTDIILNEQSEPRAIRILFQSLPRAIRILFRAYNCKSAVSVEWSLWLID